mmetsp:Transcript_17057/g.36803  ORF Transcript_17057/g.36803 Transcript_17057/m.36803 type:complete len:218 (-) Transcript_17057:1655-2308(-)
MPRAALFLHGAIDLIMVASKAPMSHIPQHHKTSIIAKSCKSLQPNQPILGHFIRCPRNRHTGRMQCHSWQCTPEQSTRSLLLQYRLECLERCRVVSFIGSLWRVLLDGISHGRWDKRARRCRSRCSSTRGWKERPLDILHGHFGTDLWLPLCCGKCPLFHNGRSHSCRRRRGSGSSTSAGQHHPHPLRLQPRLDPVQRCRRRRCNRAGPHARYHNGR